MNKTELVEKVKAGLDAKHAGLTKKDTEAAVSETLEQIMVAIEEGDKLAIVGFGSMEPVERKERKGRNPKTREEINIPASMAITFHAGKTFKERVQKLLGQGF